MGVILRACRSYGQPRISMPGREIVHALCEVQLDWPVGAGHSLAECPVGRMTKWVSF